MKNNLDITNAKYSLLSYSESMELLEEFESSNQKVAREYLGREDGILFYEKPENVDFPKFNVNLISKKEIAIFLFLLLNDDLTKEQKKVARKFIKMIN